MGNDTNGETVSGTWANNGCAPVEQVQYVWLLKVHVSFLRTSVQHYETPAKFRVERASNEACLQQVDFDSCFFGRLSEVRLTIVRFGVIDTETGRPCKRRIGRYSLVVAS